MIIKCENCQKSKSFFLEDLVEYAKPLFCEECKSLITCIDSRNWGKQLEDWIAGIVIRHQNLRSRKQDLWHTDEYVSEEGIRSELVATLILCPRYFRQWQKTVENGGKNRGNDIPTDWTHFDKPVEIKFTRYTDAHLILRPPSNGGMYMNESYVDDCYYLLVQHLNHFYCLSGWTNCVEFIKKHKVDPFLVENNQRHCWGVHVTDLNPMTSFLAQVITTKGIPKNNAKSFAILATTGDIFLGVSYEIILENRPFLQGCFRGTLVNGDTFVPNGFSSNVTLTYNQIRSLEKYNSIRDTVIILRCSEEVEHYDNLTCEGKKPKKAEDKTNFHFLQEISFAQKHQLHLKKYDIVGGICKSNNSTETRYAHCWSCKNNIDNKRLDECTVCGWIICDCGACGCGRYTKSKIS